VNQLEAFVIDSAGHARIDDPSTSVKAAKSLSSSVRQSSMMFHLLQVFVRFPATAEEAAELAGFTPADGAWKRVSDLERRGWIEDTGMTARGSSGREQRIMQITNNGKAALLS
jgi:hypothetical protein